MNLNYFLETTDTIEKGHGFNLFGPIHLMWLIIGVLSIIFVLKQYKTKDKVKIRKIIAILLLIDEIYKHLFLLIGNRWIYDYLPLHLCSINIFFCLIDAFKPNKIVRHFISIICIPGALLALLSPSWTALPLLNFMHIHSFTVHILLVMYPILLLSDKDNKPEMKYTLLSMALLLLLLIPIYFVNVCLDTNFFFLMNDENIAIFEIFKNLFGSHLFAFPILGSIIAPLMVGIWYFINSKVK